MNMTTRFFADTAERTVRTFIQAYVAAWLAAPLLGGDTQWDTLFTVDNLKYAVVAAVLALATAVGAKGFSNPDSASVLPPAAPPTAPQPPAEDDVEAPKPVLAVTPPIVAAAYSARLDNWDTVFLRPAPPGLGTFGLTSAAHNGLPVAELRPGGPLGPIGPKEQETMGLREPVAHPDADGN